jgi:excinuclease ABC subunit A
VQLQRLVDAENTVIMIEHDMRAVTQADQVIDIGPEGHEGGRLVAAGTPEQVSQVKESRTAQYIARELSRNG